VVGAKSAPRNDEDHKVLSVSTDNGEALGTDLKPVGFIFALPLGRAVYIKTLGVAPVAQNRHVGRLLFESICRRARADGYETIYGLYMKNDRLITQLLPPDAEKVAEYTLYRGG